MALDYIDIHSHLNLSPLLETKDVVLAKMQELRVGTITVGTTLETSKIAIQIAQENEHCWATIGVHPCECSDSLLEEERVDDAVGRVRFEVLEQLASHPKVVAIGETGLDYFRNPSSETKQQQRELFKKHIDLAVAVKKPLMLHVRASKGSDDAYYDALELLGSYGRKNSFSLIGAFFLFVNSFRKIASADQTEFLRPGANFHFFSGSKKCMEDIVAVGFMISVDGPITFSKDYDDMIKAVPLDKIMIETDAPYAAPAPYRGETCEPWMVIEIARKIAELKGLDLETVRTQLLDNTAKFFSLDL